MVGPVLYLEMLQGGRRGRQYVFRWIYAGWLIAQLVVLYLGYRMQDQFYIAMHGKRDPNLASQFAGSYVELFVAQQLVLILLATPAFAAGAITDEKSRGTLQYLLTANLTSWEILAGKLLGRVAQVALLALTGLPVLCFVGVFGGLDPVMVLAVAAVTIIPLFALGAASLLASVWSRHTRDAVLSLYAVGGVSYLAFWAIRSWYASLASYTASSGIRLVDRLNALLELFNPLYVVEPAWGHSDLGELGRRCLLATLAWGSIGVICLALAGWRLRGAYLRQLEGKAASGRDSQKTALSGWWKARRKPIALQPIRWKERQVEGIAPLPMLRAIPGWLGVVVIFLLTTFSSAAILWMHFPPGVSLADVWRQAASLDLPGVASLLSGISGAGDGFLVQGIVVMLLASMIVGIRCSGAVSGERERQTWEALLLTPLETRQLIRGKLWGIIGASYPYLRAYAIPAFVLSVLGGGFAIMWTLIWLAVTWLAMYYIGAAGLWCSTRSKSSWRSLLGTLGFGYVGGFVLFVAVSPLVFLMAVFIILALQIVDSILHITTARSAFGFFAFYWNAFFVSACCFLAGLFFGLAKFFVSNAEKRVANLERTRHWKNEPMYRRLRRRTGRPRYYK